MNHPGHPGYKMLHTFALKGGREPAPGSLLDSHPLRGKQRTGRWHRRADRCLPLVWQGSRHESGYAARQGLDRRTARGGRGGRAGCGNPLARWADGRHRRRRQEWRPPLLGRPQRQGCDASGVPRHALPVAAGFRRRVSRRGHLDVGTRCNLGAALGRAPFRARPPSRTAGEFRIRSRRRSQVQRARAGIRRRPRFPLRSAAAARVRRGQHHRRTDRVPARPGCDAGDHGVVDSGPSLEPLRIPVQHDTARSRAHGAHADDGAPAGRPAPELPRSGARRLRGLRARSPAARYLPHQPHAVVRRHPRQDPHAVHDAVAHRADRAECGGAARTPA